MNRLTTLVRAACAATLLSPVCALAQPGLGHHPPIAQQRYILEAGFSDAAGAKVVRVPIELADPTARTPLDQTVVLPAPLAPLRIREYLPKAELVQDVEPDAGPDARPAVLLSIVGPTQSASRWLLAGDPQYNRLTSLIGTWRFMAVDDRDHRDRLFYDFQTEHIRTPSLRVTDADGSKGSTIAAEPGTIHDVVGRSGQLRVLEFYPHYAISDKTNQPVNLSVRRINPAVLVELERNGVREKRWVFARFPDYTTGAPRQIPWKVTLDCPAEGKAPRPDVAVVLTRPETWEVWVRHSGGTDAKPAVAGRFFDLPSSQYRFRLDHLLPSGRLVESYRPVDDKNSVPALRIETMDEADKSVAVWLTPNKRRILTTKSGPMTLQVLTDLDPGGGHP